MREMRQLLDALLSETPHDAEIRERTAFDEIAAGRSKIVIFGAGRLGRKILGGLNGTGLEVVAFADNNPHLWGTAADGIPVLSPQDAADRHSAKATFVIAIWHPSHRPLMATLLAQLRGLGCAAAGFPLLFWRHPQEFLPYYFWDLPSRLLRQAADISSAFDLLHDEASQQTFVAQAQLRLQADFDCIGAPVPGEQYFPGLFSLTPSECFVDCGAFTGDTLQTFIRASGNSYRKAIAFEADSAVLSALRTFVNSIGERALLHEAVVGSYNGVASFSGDGVGGGAVTSAAGVEVARVRLDDVLAKEHASFIKMDIEGAELDALEGARCVIERDQPVLAVCGYHKPDHLWRVAASLKSLAPDSALFLRAHCADGLDAVWYSVPPERQLKPFASSASPSKAHARAQRSHS